MYPPVHTLTPTHIHTPTRTHTGPFAVVENNLLSTMLESLEWLEDIACVKVQALPHSTLRAINPNSSLVRMHLFGPVTSDVANLLSHKVFALVCVVGSK